MGSASVLQTSSCTKDFSNFGIMLVDVFCFISQPTCFFFISVILLDLKFSAGICLQSLLRQDHPFPFLFLPCSKLLGEKKKKKNSHLFIIRVLEYNCWKTVSILPRITLSSRITGASTDKNNKTDSSRFLILKRLVMRANLGMKSK